VKVLVIDDSQVMRRIHRNVLLEHKVKEDDIYEASDGAEALAIAGSQPIGLFLVDWNMPKVDGLELVRAIRAMSEYAATPVVMITSEAARYNVVEAIQAGVTNYVVKPIKGDVLWSKLSKYVEA
jgi:two-component system, chemotaxis family, chemotaxis protein CheY